MASSSSYYFAFFLLSLFVQAFGTDVSYDERALTINGKRRIILSGSIHYPRSTPGMWPELIKKAKEGGLDAIETYVFWNAHEPVRRQYDFTGNNDLIRFLKTVQEAGLYAVLRIGPYICGEWNYGGFPVWLHNIPGIELRTANDVFMNEMQNFTTLIVNMAKQEKLFASQGGPIIIAQIENEYGNVISHYGDAGKAYRDWCANMAEAQHIGVPWIMCQEDDAPESVINTCNGWYCDNFSPNNNKSPKMWTENWTGWFKNWGGKDPHRTAEDLAFSVARFFQTGGTFQNYYMYHGGTNFGRTAGGPYITTSYDYDAPLDEFGNLNQPKWGHLKVLHETLKTMEKTLTHGNISHIDMGNGLSLTKYSTDSVSGCFFGNINGSSDATVSYEGNDYNVPAWSVSILPECKTEVYNTAKVAAQTTIMVKKSNDVDDTAAPLSWSWMPEHIHPSVLQLKKADFTANLLIDQKAAANDASDYLWYSTEVHVNKDDPVWSNNMTLRVNATGQVLHAYVNGKHLGSKWATYGVFNYVYEEKVKLLPGKNIITLLSATIGLQNYGPRFDMVQNGVPGPVELVSQKGDETIIKDLSFYRWSYKVGLDGVDIKKVYQESNQNSLWRSSDLPLNKMMTWYKASFKAPLGTDPVVVDLIGMGKGFAWINGHNIGRYWPSYLAETDGCSVDPCDYRGSYSNPKCVTNCGKPTQQYYHVPRDFLNEDNNTIVLFEEMGGNPSHVAFKTVTVGKSCAHAEEGTTVVLACQGGARISDVEFVSFGDPKGACGDFFEGSCKSDKDVFDVVRQACVGNEACSLDVSEESFGSAANCAASLKKRLAVQVTCKSH